MIVSGLVWILTYIVPFVYPRQISEKILFLNSTNENPIDPDEIRVYIHQYLNYDDWKMLTAKGTLKHFFDKKFEEFQENENKFWEGLKDKVESIPIKDAIKEIENELEESNISIHKESLSKLLEKYQRLYQKNKNTKIWYFKELSNEDSNKLLKIDTTPNIEKGHPPAVMMGEEMPFRGYTPEEFAKIFELRNKQFIERDGKWVSHSDNNKIPSSDSFLMKVGIEKPVEISKNQKSKIFNHILLNFKLEENVYKKGFSVALSNMDDSVMIFESILNNCSDITPLKRKILNKIKYR